MQHGALIVRWLVGVAALVGVSVQASAGDERWHVIEMMGGKAGWMRTSSATLADGSIRSESEMSFKVGRGAVEVGIRMETEFVETANGKPVSMRVVQEFGAAPVIVEYTFHADHTSVKTTQAGRTTESREDAPPADALTPAAAERETQRRIEAGEESISLTILDASTGVAGIEVTRKLKGRGAVEALGKTVAATEWAVTQSAFPDVTSVEWLDREGRMVRGSMDLGGIQMTILASEKELALADAPPPELMASTLITPNRPIEAPREASVAEYRVRLSEGSLPDLPSAGAQTFQRTDERSGVVVADVDRVDRVAADFDTAPYLEASQMVDGEDPEIRRLAAIGEGETPARRAELLRVATHRHINRKSLDVGLASASDVARTREGDCTEHGVLLAAMLRAAGIPSRVVSGAVYIDEFLGSKGVFGYHMWTQALLPTDDGGLAWVDLDATLGPERAHDAAHIAMSVSALGDGEMINSLAALAPLMGRLHVDVVRAESGAPAR